MESTLAYEKSLSNTAKRNVKFDKPVEVEAIFRRADGSLCQQPVSMGEKELDIRFIGKYVIGVRKYALRFWLDSNQSIESERVLTLRIKPSVTAMIDFYTRCENVYMIILTNGKMQVYTNSQKANQTKTNNVKLEYSGESKDPQNVNRDVNQQIDKTMKEHNRLQQELTLWKKRNQDIKSQIRDLSSMANDENKKLTAQKDKISQVNDGIKDAIERALQKKAEYNDQLTNVTKETQKIQNKIVEEKKKKTKLGQELKQAKKMNDKTDKELLACYNDTQKRISTLLADVGNTTQLVESDMQTIRAMRGNEFIPVDRVDELTKKYQELKICFGNLYQELADISNVAETMGSKRQDDLNAQEQ